MAAPVHLPVIDACHMARAIHTTPATPPIHRAQVVLDNFLDEPTRQGLLEALTAPGWAGQDPPAALWERATADAAQRPATWGLKPGVLSRLAAGDLPAKLEVQSRLCKL